MRLVRTVGCVVAAAAGLGCSLVLGLNNLVADRTRDGGSVEGGTGDGGTVDGCASSCGTSGCGDCPDAGQVSVASPDGAPYSIDALEVTVGQYQAWLNTNPSLRTQGPECTWNDTYQPTQFSAAALRVVSDASVQNVAAPCRLWNMRGDNVPITCIDWCDAQAYCKWANKRLCGHIGGNSVDITQGTPFNDPTQSEWYAACSAGGTKPYPYGTSYEAGACNDNGLSTENVGSFPRCVGGAPGLFDMSGNAGEWADECSEYPGDPAVEQNCTKRGGAYWGTPTELSCGAYAVYVRGGLDDSTGFRCCSP